MDDGATAEPFALTRDTLLRNDLAARLARSSPEFRITSPEEREASLRAILAERPDHGSGLWLFAYGSLIWNPAFHFVDRRPARIDGWHRAFCLASSTGRGTPDNPGLMLGLMPGGACVGAVFRIAEPDIAQELDLVWRREMVGDGYVPRWVAISDPDDPATYQGAAIVFTVNPQARNFAGGTPEPDVVRRLATACGYLGSACDYLFRTEAGLAAMGLRDPFVSRIADGVRSAQTS